MTNPRDFLFQKWSGSFSLHERRVASSFSEDKATAKPIHTRNLPLYSMENSELPAGQVQVLASLIPDLVLNSDSAGSSSEDINPFLAVLLCADISGFTSLSETLAKSGDEGAYKLTALINKILGNMVSAIYENGGDVWKFSGDAFLAFWKVGMHDNFAAVIHRAVFCALQIQKNYGMYETEFKTILRVKIGMSAGCVVWCMVGYNLSKRTILVGSPINEQINAQRKCSSGDVIITATMWSHLNPLCCVYEQVDDGKFIKISHMVGYMGLVSRSEIRLHLGSNMKNQMDQKVRRFSEFEHGGLRNTDLLLCIMSPVIQQMQADLKLDYLTEQRTLTIMFINILPRKMFTTDLISLVDGAYKIIHKLTMKAGGILDKVSLFDKDVMFVIIFGKNGYVNELRATASLFCGYDIREACIPLNGVNNVSVGIATGDCYCGVVGHPQRQEWTVIGSTVNKAARLMTAYAGQITCDQATRDDAELPSYYFTKQETVPLKGFSNDGFFYKFVADKGLNFKNSVKDGLLPLLDRESEMTVFRRSLDDLKKDSNPPEGLLIVGEPKIGKSRLLDEMIIEAINQQLNPVIVGLRLGHSFLAYAAAVHFLCHVFRINKENVEVDLKRLLSVLLVDQINNTDLIHIEELFDTNVKNQTVTEGLKRLFLLAVEMGIKSSVIVIDDVHFCDDLSRELFCSLVESRSKFIIFTQDSSFTLMENLQIIELQPMADDFMPALVCQFMNVQAVQENIIGFVARGGFCQTQLKALLDNGFIQIIDTSPDVDQDLNLIYPDSQLLNRFIVCVPSLEKFPPPREYIDEQWPNDEEFYHQDRLNISAVLGSQVKRHRAASYTGKRLLRQRLRFQSIPELKKSVTNIFKYNSASNFAEDDFELIGCFSEQNEEMVRIYPRDVSICDIVIEESVNIFQKRYKFFSENGLFGSEEEKKTIESEDSQLPDEQSEQIVAKLIPKRRNSSLTIQNRAKQESLIKAVVRVPDMDLHDCALSQSYVSFLTIFDSLRPFEQLILKCSSVIGSVFHRPMLDYLLRNNNHFFISRTVSHLFQLNILTCSLSGDGQDCICHDATDITNFSVHKSGFCEHPCFQDPSLRDVVYEMIPPNVKKMFHERAIEYLTSTSLPIRCPSCRLELDKYPYLESLFRRDIKREKTFAYDEKLGVFLETLSKMPLLHFHSCTCVYTENDTYRQIIQHCDKTGLKEASIKYKVNCANLKISLGRFDEANQILNDVEENITSVALPRKEGRKVLQELKYLKGKICFETGDLASALRHLFDVSSPSGRFALGGLLFSNLLFYKKNIRSSKIAMKSLNLITRIYILEGNWEAARHVNATTIKMLQHRDSFELCKAYTYLVDIALSQHGLKFSKTFENDRIISAAFSLLPASHASGAILLGRILNALYLTRSMGAGDLRSSYALLKALQKISFTIKVPPTRGYLLMEEIHILMMMGHLGEAHAAILNLGKMDKVLYHAICLDFLRIAGFWIEKPEDSRDYLAVTLGSRQGTIDPTTFHRATLSLVLWIFWVNPPKVLDVCALVNLTSSPRPVYCVSDCFVRLMELELLIMEELFLPNNATQQPEFLRDWMTEIQIMAQNFQIMQPSFLLMHAYKGHRLAKNRSQTSQILVEAEQVAKKQHNELYIQRIAVCRKDWCSVGESVNHVVQQDLPGHAFVAWPCSNWSDFMLRYP